MRRTDFFAIEGGEFLSSSASGYSKGLSLLLLGQKSDDKRMKVAPWNQYRLVDHEKNESDLQLASRKHRLSGGCASLGCFGRTSEGHDEQPPLKVAPTQPQGVLPGGSTNVRDKEPSTLVTKDIRERPIALRSSMKNSGQSIPQTIVSNGQQESLTEEGSIPEGVRERRKIQWTDAYGKELTEIREFEPSEHGESVDEFGNGNAKTCACRIM